MTAVPRPAGYLLRMAVLLGARAVQTARVGYYKLLSSDVSVEGRLRRRQPLLIVGSGRIVVRGEATVGYFPSPAYYSGYARSDLRKQNACIEIGDGVVMNNCATLIADGATISIGQGTLIGVAFTAMTSDAHGLRPESRTASDYPRESVRIGRNVFIGNNVTVLKGVTVGDNSVVGSGSVVARGIPGNVVAAGVPCRVVRAF